MGVWLCAALILGFQSSFADEVLRPQNLKELAAGEVAISVEELHPISGVQVAWINVAALKRDFPHLQSFSQKQIQQWLIENFSVIRSVPSTPQPRQTSRSRIKAYTHPSTLGVSVEVKGSSSGQPQGLMNLKGIDQTLSLKQATQEMLQQKIAQRRAQTTGEGHLETVETYAILQLPGNHSNPRAVSLRQAHRGGAQRQGSFGKTENNTLVNFETSTRKGALPERTIDQALQALANGNSEALFELEQKALSRQKPLKQKANYHEKAHQRAQLAQALRYRNMSYLNRRDLFLNQQPTLRHHDPLQRAKEIELLLLKPHPSSTSRLLHQQNLETLAHLLHRNLEPFRPRILRELLPALLHKGQAGRSLLQAQSSKLIELASQLLTRNPSSPGTLTALRLLRGLDDPLSRRLLLNVIGHGLSNGSGGVENPQQSLELRMAAIEALIDRTEAEDLHRIRRWLEDPHPEIRRLTARLLRGRFHPLHSEPILLNAVQNTLNRLNPQNEGDRQIRFDLELVLESKEFQSCLSRSF